MAFENPFVLDTEEYTRNVDPFGQALHQYATYLHQMTGKPYDECKLGAQRVIKSGKHKSITNPEVVFFQRGNNGDRDKQTTDLY